MPTKPDAATEPAGERSPMQAGPATPDEYAGQGGAYEIDPATGKRRLVERTNYQPAAPETTQPAAAENPKE